MSQRYSEATENTTSEARRQDSKNRQNSIDDMSTETREWFADVQARMWALCKTNYEEALQKGIAKECARFLLPVSTQTTLYMTGSMRSFMHYIQVRLADGTQKEHKDVALVVQRIFVEQLPTVAAALGWLDTT